MISCVVGIIEVLCVGSSTSDLDVLRSKSYSFEVSLGSS